MNKYILYAFAILFLCGCGSYPLKSKEPTGLHIAARENITSTIEDWIKSGVSVDETYITSTGNHFTGIVGVTPLMEAASYGSLDVAKLLVNEGANLYAEQYPNTSLEGARLYNKETAFDLAVMHGHLNMVEYLWEVSDKKTFSKNGDGNIRSALSSYCRKHEEQYKELILFLVNNVACKEQIDGAFNKKHRQSDCFVEIKNIVYSDA
jgi:ankyrin repeat protein